MTVLVKCASHRARNKLFRIVPEGEREALYSLIRETGKGVYRIPDQYEAEAKALTGVSGFRDGDDLARCWPADIIGNSKGAGA